VTAVIIKEQQGQSEDNRIEPEAGINRPYGENYDALSEFFGHRPQIRV
jgi:hypothetical protein